MALVIEVHGENMEGSGRRHAGEGPILLTTLTDARHVMVTQEYLRDADGNVLAEFVEDIGAWVVRIGALRHETFTDVIVSPREVAQA